MLMPEKIKGLLGNHFFQIAALIGTGKRWALPPTWETPLEGTLAPEHLLVQADTCPSIWNAAPYLRGPFRFRERTVSDEIFPEGHYLGERYWADRVRQVKNILGYNCATNQEAASFVGPAAKACAIHLRRGEKRAVMGKYGFPFPVTYVLDALDHIPTNCRLLYFSDEPEWAVQMLRSIGIEAENGEHGVQHPVQAMARMSACRYLIGSNSTFSWWAGYLNPDPEKRIFMPGWRRLDFSNNEQITAAWPPESERPAWHLLNPTRKLAIIIAAYKAERFIEDCLRGFMCQTPPPGWELDIRIGVDGCPETAAKLDSLGVPYFYSPRNVGAYVMRNSLIEIAMSEAYSIFDADDVPMPDYAARCIPALYHTGITTCSRLEVGEHLEDIGEKQYARAYGRAMFQHEILAMAGGFRPERCDSDGDFIWRVQDMGYSVTFSPPPFLMLRRQHPNQLTRHPSTAIRSAYRVAIQARHKAARLAGERYIHPVTTRLEYRHGSWNGINPSMPQSSAMEKVLAYYRERAERKEAPPPAPATYVKIKKKVIRRKVRGNQPAITREENKPCAT